MEIHDLEQQLASAQAHLKKVLKAGLDPNRLQVHFDAFEAVASAQRALAAAKGEEYAVPYDIGFEPEAAVSEAVLLQTEDGAVLSFSAVRPQPNGKRADAGYGIVEIDRCSLTKFGYPNDEALPGHPLHEKGLGAYGVYEVHNSSWVKLMTQQNRVAFPKTPDSKQRHFIITFHDCTFECIARDLKASTSTKRYAEIFDEMRKCVFPYYEGSADPH